MPPKRKFGAASKASGGDKEPWGTWPLNNQRQISISMFTGSPKIDIRETYTKDDQQLPGKKGISLSIEQWKLILEKAPEIEKVLKEKGEWDVEEKEKPKKKEVKSKEKSESDEEEHQEEEVVTKKSKKKKSKAAVNEDESE